MDKNFNLPELIFEGGKESLDLGIVGNVALKAAGSRQLGDQALGLELHALVLVTDGQGCAGLVQSLGNSPGNRTLVGQPEDHGRLTRQIDHADRKSTRLNSSHL